MGFFSGSKTYVFSTAQDLYVAPPKYLPSSVTAAVLAGEDITESILKDIIDSVVPRMKRTFNYGRKHYTLGLPKGTIVDVDVDFQEVERIIEQEEGREIYLRNCKIDFLDTDYLAYDYLQNERGWDSGSNIIHNPEPDWPTKDGGTYYYFSSTELGSGSYTGQLKILYKYYKTERETFYPFPEITHTRYVAEYIPLPEGKTYYPEQHYYHAEYQYITEGEPQGAMQLWLYRINSNLYPTLDPDYEGRATVWNSPFFPIIPIRLDHTDMTDESLKDTDLYKTSKKLLRHAGLDFEEIGAQVQQGVDEGNDIDHSVIFISVDLFNDNKSVKKYIYDFFWYWMQSQSSTQGAYDSWKAKMSDFPLYQVTNPPSNYIEIKDKGLKVILRNNYITQIVKSDRKLGKVGTVETQVIKRDPFRAQARDQYGHLLGTSVSANESSLILRKQITTNAYEEIEIHGLQHENHVTKKRIILTNIEEVPEEEDNDNFLIPINYYIMENFSLIDRIEIFHRSYRIIHQTIIKVKLKWYQTTFFRGLVYTIILVSAVMSMGTSSGLWTVVGSMLKTYTFLQAAAIIFTIMYAFKFALSKFIEFAAKEFGMDVIIFLYIAYMAYQIYTGTATQGDNTGVPPANDLMTITQAYAAQDQSWMSAISFEAIALGGGVQPMSLGQVFGAAAIGSIGPGIQQGVSQYIGSKQEELVKQQEAFSEEEERRQEALKEAQELLGIGDDEELEERYINPMMFTNMGINYRETETPESFLQRTKYSNNVAVDMLEFIPNYVDISLSLPKSVKDIRILT